MKRMSRVLCAVWTAVCLCLLIAIPVLATAGSADVVSADMEVAEARSSSLSTCSVSILPGVDWLTLAIVALVVLLVLTAVGISIRETIRGWRDGR